MRKQPTATLLAKMKTEAKNLAKGTKDSYNSMLEQVARKHGFASWHAVTRGHEELTAVGEADAELVVDPRLPDAFDSTPNEQRSDEEINQWWLRPFAISREDGSYEVRCLDGGAWDRSTYYGIAPNLEEATILAANKLASWRQYLDRPVATALGDGRWALTVDSLDPRLPRAVVYSGSDVGMLQEMLNAWNYLLKTDPHLAAKKLARAREQAAISIPTEAEMAEQYAILSRLSVLESQPHRPTAETTDPMREDIARCVERGLVLAERVEGTGARPAPAKWKVWISESGKELLAMMEKHLEATGQK